VAAGELGAQTPQRRDSADRFRPLEIGEVSSHRIQALSLHDPNPASR